MNPSAEPTLQAALPEPVRRLFQALPLSEAMPALVPAGPNTPYLGLAEEAARAARSHLQAGIWLYVDDLDRSHAISQSLHDATGSYWHAIMHRREGDFGNSKYWLRQAGAHPSMEFDAVRFVDDVAKEYCENPANLIEMQRREWSALFNWCVAFSA